MKKGLTLIEVLLTVGIFAILVGFSFPVYQNFQNRNDLEVTMNVTVQSLRRAQSLSKAVAGDTNWGVKLQSGSLTIFKGASYASRDQNYDESFEIPLNITPSGVSEVVFNKFSGTPQTTGAISIITTTNESRNININAKGIITY